MIRVPPGGSSQSSGPSSGDGGGEILFATFLDADELRANHRKVLVLH